MPTAVIIAPSPGLLNGTGGLALIAGDDAQETPLRRPCALPKTLVATAKPEKNAAGSPRVESPVAGIGPLLPR